ncbi:CHRD domain-containing protein [Archangium gephyra]|uniref:CHRD domain-containing protein n=1 Tax=Archangium gephyra TaxID=48 RepID=UPI003B819E8D
MHTRKTNRWTVLGMLGAGLLVLAGCGGQSYVATTQLSGANEVPPVTTNANGVATATLDGDKLTVTGTFSGLQSNLQEVSGTGSAAHVHQAAQGTNGPVVFSLGVTTSEQRNGSYTGTKNLSKEEQEAFKGGLFYVNVHSVNAPGGEIRGQLIPTESD